MPPRNVSALPFAADEVVIFQIRQSSVFLTLQLVGLALIALILILVLQALNLHDPPVFGSFGVIGLLTIAIIIVVSLVALVRILDYRTTLYTLTNRRVEQDFGILQHSSYAATLFEIEKLDITQGLFARLFGFGNLVIISNSIGKEAIVFRAIPHPDTYHQQVEDALP